MITQLIPSNPQKRFYPLPFALISQRDLFQMSTDSLYEPKRNFSSPTKVTYVTNQKLYTVIHVQTHMHLLQYYRIMKSRVKYVNLQQISILRAKSKF